MNRHLASVLIPLAGGAAIILACLVIGVGELLRLATMSARERNRHNGHWPDYKGW